MSSLNCALRPRKRLRARQQRQPRLLVWPTWIDFWTKPSLRRAAWQFAAARLPKAERRKTLPRRARKPWRLPSACWPRSGAAPCSSWLARPSTSLRPACIAWPRWRAVKPPPSFPLRLTISCAAYSDPMPRAQRAFLPWPPLQRASRARRFRPLPPSCWSA